MEKNKNDISRQEFDDLKSDVKDLHKVFDQITAMTVSIEKLAIEMKYMREEQTKADKRLTNLEEKPIKRYDNLVTNAVTTVIGLVIGAVAVMIGLKK